MDEPVRLASEAERLNAELESLVMDNYKVFVENLTCSVHLKLEVSHKMFSKLFVRVGVTTRYFTLLHRTKSWPIYPVNLTITFMSWHSNV